MDGEGHDSGVFYESFFDSVAVVHVDVDVEYLWLIDYNLRIKVILFRGVLDFPFVSRERCIEEFDLRITLLDMNMID